jgi:23S rRNA pseudouridine955/2504/2580 synthase
VNTLATLESTIVFEDNRLIVLDKPSGWAVHGGSGVKLGVIETLRQARPRAKFLELVHRLDRDTSGLLLVAKKTSALRELHEQLRDHEGLEKHYLALLAGDWLGGEDAVKTLDLPLQKNILAGGERVVRVHPEGKPAQTRFTPLLCLPQVTLCRVAPLTGRTHQIRVHAAALDCPVAGDEKYGLAEANRRLRAQGLRRMFLHAEQLRFSLQGEPMHLHAPLPLELRQCLQGLAHPSHAAQLQALNL